MKLLLKTTISVLLCNLVLNAQAKSSLRGNNEVTKKEHDQTLPQKNGISRKVQHLEGDTDVERAFDKEAEYNLNSTYKEGYDEEINGTYYHEKGEINGTYYYEEDDDPYYQDDDDDIDPYYHEKGEMGDPYYYEEDDDPYYQDDDDDIDPYYHKQEEIGDPYYYEKEDSPLTEEELEEYYDYDLGFDNPIDPLDEGTILDILLEEEEEVFDNTTDYGMNLSDLDPGSEYSDFDYFKGALYEEEDLTYDHNTELDEDAIIQEEVDELIGEAFEEVNEKILEEGEEVEDPAYDKVEDMVEKMEEVLVHIVEEAEKSSGNV